MQDPNDDKTLSLLETPVAFRGVSPPMVGWWLTRNVIHIDAAWTTRRWWNGTGWSAPCRIGGSDEEADAVRTIPAILRPEQIEWQGRATPDALMVYPYALEARTDAEAWDFNVRETHAQHISIKLLYDPTTAPIKPASHRRNLND